MTHEPDQQDASLEQSLREYYHRSFGQSHGPAPAPDMVWRQVAAHPGPRTAPTPWWTRFVARRAGAPSGLRGSHPQQSRRGFAVIALCTLVALVVGGVVYSEAIMRPSSTIGFSAPTQHLQFVDVNITRSVGNMTLHLQKAYADANNLFLLSTTDYSGDASRVPPSSDWDIQLSANGALVPLMGGKIAPDSRELWTTPGATPSVGASGKMLTASALWDFDGAAIHGNPTTLHVQLRLTPPAGLLAGQARAQGASAAPLTMEFTVPFHAGKAIPVNQTATSKGHALTLDRVVIAPSETRFYFRDDPSTYAYAAELQVAGRVFKFEVGGISSQGTHEYALIVDSVQAKSPMVVGAATQTTLDQVAFQSLEGQTGVWTVKVTQLYDYTTGAFSGNWQFTVMVD
ncbi:MAG: hypothetical protein ACM3N4_13520 [Nitrososphaerota archaeon]